MTSGRRLMPAASRCPEPSSGSACAASAGGRCPVSSTGRIPYQVRDGGWRSRLLRSTPPGLCSPRMPNARHTPADICLTAPILSKQLCQWQAPKPPSPPSLTFTQQSPAHPLVGNPIPRFRIPIPWFRIPIPWFLQGSARCPAPEQETEQVPGGTRERGEEEAEPRAGPWRNQGTGTGRPSPERVPA